MILPGDSQEFSDNLQILSILYKEIKQIVLLAEIVNDERAVLLTSVNEMRNAFDHIMRCYLDESDYKKHIDKARGHLYRAGYDAYELMAIDIFTQIKEILNERSTEAISHVIPKYYKVLLPRMQELEKELMDARANKKPDSHKSATAEDIAKITDKEFKQYGEIVRELIEIKETITNAVPEIIQEEEKGTKLLSEHRISTYVTMALGSLGIFVAVMSWFMS